MKFLVSPFLGIYLKYFTIWSINNKKPIYINKNNHNLRHNVQRKYQQIRMNIISIQFYLILFIISNNYNKNYLCYGYDSFNDISEKGNYIGCFHEKIDVYKTSIFAGNVQSCLIMCESIYFRYAVLSLEKCACTNTIEHNDQVEKSICNIRCTRNKAQYCGGVDAQSYYDTGVRVSGPPKKVEIINKTDTSMTVIWDEPPQPDGVTSYIIKPIAVKSFANYPIFTLLEWSVQKEERQFEMIALHPATLYNVSVIAMCENEICGTKSIFDETDIGVPDPEPEEPRIISKTESTITIYIYPAYNNNGPITSYRIIVMFMNDNIIRKFDEEFLSDYNQSIDDGIPYYITADLDFTNESRIFTVGDGTTDSRGYYNAALPKNSYAHIIIGIVSTHNGITKYRYSQIIHQKQQNRIEETSLVISINDDSVVALSTACIIFAILLVASIFVYCCLKFKTRNRLQRLNDTHELSFQGPMDEAENNGFENDEFVKSTFKAKLQFLIDTLDDTQKFPRNSVRLNINDIIACGNFGEVISGSFYINHTAIDCQVHVISDDMPLQDQAIFLHDLKQLIQLMPHEKFSKFFGISVSPDWFYVLFERMPCYLKKKLLESRVPDSSRFSSVSEECILQWMYEIVTAMEYLETNKVPHKTLCSYNVYITQLKQVKLSLFGPTPFGDMGKSIDITRWMAPEVIHLQQYSIKSDVWSYACVSWECCTLGGTLYSNITSKELIQKIRIGGRPEQTNFINNDLYQLFLNCWQIDPNERPAFEEIAFNIRQILLSPRHSLSFDRTENIIIPYYLPLLEAQNI